MMFKNPFPSLVTRTGVAIGKAGERAMLASTSVSAILKSYRNNADGSTTMSHKQNGLARFITQGGGACGISVGESDLADIGSRHLVTFTKKTTFPKTLTVRFKDITAVSGIDYAPVPRNCVLDAPQDHVTFSGMNVTVNYSNGDGYGTFFIIVESLSPVKRTYEISVGCASAVGTTRGEG